MANVVLNGRPFEIELAAFDKDGTLIDFYHLWGCKARRCVETLVNRVGGDEDLRHTLYQSIGYNPQTRQTAGNGPLATATMVKIYTIAAAVLYQHGLSWDDAERCVQESFAPSMGALPTADIVQPLGDVAALFRQLTQAGARIALVTTDDRAATQATLPLLGVEEHVSLLACGDDQTATKPAPDAIRRLGAKLGIEPAHTMMVGDTTADLLMASRAGVGCRVGVLSGVGDRATLAPHADVVLGSIDDIRVVP